METNEVSIHQARLFAAIGTEWRTATEIAELASVKPRTARHHLLRFVQLGIADVAEVFPGHRYRRAEKASKRNASAMIRLKAAAKVFGIEVAA
jgi:DNA-binding transcriptional ArsR family regulator